MALALKTRPQQKTSTEQPRPSQSARTSYQTLQFRIIGVCPLIMHNGQTADPLNPHSRSIAEITGKSKKTDADHREVARREWFAGLYLMNQAPCLPGEVIEAAMIKGAMKEKRGPAAKAGMIVENNSPLEYDGPRNLDELWEDELFRLRAAVKVKASKVIRTRPRFNEWAASVEVKYLPSLLNEESMRSFLITAGEQIGIMDWRPRFGRFVVK
jgi:hypothetical protein